MNGIKNLAVIGSELAIAWDDGGEAYLPFERLRRACPCASCQGEPDALGRVAKPEPSYEARSFQLVRYEPVGGYAIQLHWADGHGTGLYSYDYLRKLGDAGDKG